MRRPLILLAALALWLPAVQPAMAVSTTIVLSQTYGGAGCGTVGCSTYKNDYIELFNRSAAPVSVNGWSVQYAAATGTAWQVTNLPNVSIPAGGYLLVAEAVGANGVNNLPTPDATGTIAMSATAGKIALVNSTVALSGACPAGATIVDLIGYGTTANCNEGGANAPVPSTTTADLRAAAGCTDTDSNSTDFTAAAPNPRNSGTALNPCGVALPNLTINDVSLNEGNAGTTSFTFTVSLSAPAGPGGVTFDIATADGTATQPGDYTQKALTGQTIPAGSSTYSFTVLVNGDTTPETNETFLVNVTNITGANVTDGQGQGTIQNDDAAPNLTINDVSLNEGNAGTTTFTFTVSLSAPAPAGGVTFDIATANSSAVAPGDYTTKTLTGQTIPAGSSTYTFDVLVNGDITPETNETFFVNVTNVTNAITVDGQGLGTIQNDDLAKIHDVQGNGAATPIPGATVTVEGVVVGNFQGAGKLQGFFLQEEDADADADPSTSEGIFIFCNSCPTAVAEGQRVRATGAVSEFNGMTEITASTVGSVVITNAGNNLAQVTPAAIDLPIAGDVNAFYETREGMLVTFVDTLTVSEYFEMARFGHLELFEGGRPRQFTEMSPPSVAGLAAHLDNLDRRRVILDDDNNSQNASLTPFQADGSQFVFHPRANGGFSVGTQGIDFFRGGDLVNGLTGVLHWSFPGTGADTWRIRPVAATPATFTVANPRPATPPAVGGAIRAVGMNLLNYFTTIDTTPSNNTGPCSPSGTLDCRGADSVAELNRQRERAAIVICTLNADVYGFAELENTTASASITDLLGAVNALCGGAHPYAFANTGGTLGTDAIRVQQIYRTGIVSPVGSPLSDLDPIHSRPPTAQTYDVVDAANPAFGQRFTVVINHFKSKGSSAGLPGDGDAGDGAGFSNATRTAQASRLLTWINGTVIPAAGDPDVLLLGDFNAYAKEDPINTLVGGGYTDLEVLFQGANAYSYLFDGQLGHLDYGFASSSLLPQVADADAWHINADESDLFDYNDEVKDTGEAAFEEKPDGSALVPPRVLFQPASPYRASDHDPVLVGLFQVADVSLTKTDSPDPVIAGMNLTYTITVTNDGPDAASTVSWSDTLPAGTTFVSLPAVTGWSCMNVAGTVSCSNPSLAVGNAVFMLTVAVDPGVAAGTVLSNTVAVTSTTGDPDSADHSATATTTVATSADLSVTKVDSPDPVNAGENLTYTITVTNDGPSNAASVSLSDTLPAGTTFVSLPAVTGWSCMNVAGTVSCSNPSLAVGNAVFTLTVAVDPGVAAGTVLSNTVEITSATGDPDSADHSATATTTVAASADLSVTKVDSPDPVDAGENLTYTITVTNDGPSNAASVSLSDTLPAETTFVSLSSPGGWSCNSLTVGLGGTLSCSIANLPPGDSEFTLTVLVALSTPDGTVISNEATVSTSTSDPDSDDHSATATTTVNASGLGSLFMVAPCRAVDTRSGSPLQDGVPETFALKGLCGIPATATSVVLNVTAITPSGAGDLTLYASDATPPAFFTMPFKAGITRSLFAIVSLSSDAAGEVTVAPSVAGSGTVHVLLDVMGYFK
ncbi:MAG: uncharacterized protein QOH06_180 [Acidobacteriota bacterium]|jgi:uncharacterized repeat protein (TIGR01451 family)|nr:uncharacterized protein [Acidobacteriota bacterium]